MRVVASLAVLAAFFGVARHVSALARQDLRFRVDPTRLAAEASPGWMPEPVAARLREQLRRLPALSLFDPAFTGRMRDAAEDASPWIGGVSRVERLFPDRARLDLELRLPLVALACGGGGRAILDRDGRVLQVEAAEPWTRFGVPLLPIQGAPEGVRVALGETVTEPEVQAAILVAREFSSLDEPWAGVLRSIDPAALLVRVAPAGRVGGPFTWDGEVYLQTSSGVLVKWGRACAYQPTGILEDSPAAKLERLATLLEQFPGLDGLEEVRLNHARPTYQRAPERLADAAAAKHPADP